MICCAAPVPSPRLAPTQAMVQDSPITHFPLSPKHPDAEGTRKVLHHYNSCVYELGGSLQWSPPPLPFERFTRSQRYTQSNDEEHIDPSSNDEKPRQPVLTADWEDGRGEWEEGVTDAPFESEAEAEDAYEGTRDDFLSVAVALRHIYDQKKRTVEQIREKRLPVTTRDRGGEKPQC